MTDTSHISVISCLFVNDFSYFVYELQPVVGSKCTHYSHRHPWKKKRKRKKKTNPEPYRHYMNINENKIWSRNPLRSSKRSPGASAVGAVSLCLFYFFSSTVLPKYSFWNCWNSSSVNKDFASLAFFTGLSGWFLDCLPLLWFTIYVRQKSNQHVRATCRQQKQFISSQWWLWIYLGYQ